MKQTQYLTTVVRSANRLEIEVPNLFVGQTVEVIVITPDNPVRNSPIIEACASPVGDRQVFLRSHLPNAIAA